MTLTLTSEQRNAIRACREAYDDGRAAGARDEGRRILDEFRAWAESTLVAGSPREALNLAAAALEAIIEDE